MDINQQIQTLIDQAPQDGQIRDAIAAIAPMLKRIAGQLKHPQYYVLQTLNQNWVMTTLNHRTQTGASKNVIYAFSGREDALAHPNARDMQVIAVLIPVTHLLFQIIAMPPVDSIVFLESPGNPNKVTEISCSMMQNQIQLHLQRLKTSSPPPDIA